MTSERRDGFRTATLLTALFGSALALVATLGPVPEAEAQTPTMEQLDLLRSLPPDQQRQILEQFGGRQPSGATSGIAPASPVSRPKAGTDDSGSMGFVSELPRLRAGDALLLSVEINGSLSSETAGPLLGEYRRRLLAGNPYTLDRMGRLELRGTDAIVLAGLTAEEAASRLNADARFVGLRLDVRLLPVEPEIKPFGYDLFANVPTTFAPATDIPVPSEYVVGPGDTLQVQLIGERGGSYALTVGRDGTVDFPQLGPITVAGQRFMSVKAELEQRVVEQMIGMRANVTMGPLRSIQVFVLGEAERPGSYTVSGLSTITNALFASGGVKPIGSLRNIQLKRGGQIVARIDLYDLLLNGDTSGDRRLLPGDVIFIPPVGPTVGVAGEVQRPAIYELNDGSRVSDLLHLTGGLTPRADPRTARLERIDNRRNRTILDIDLTSANGRVMRLQSGDIIRIQPIRDSLEGAVQLSGNVHRERLEQYRPGMRLTDLVQSLDELRPLSDRNYVLIRRETGPDRRVSVVSADLAAAFAAPGSPDNVSLQPRDRVVVFDLAKSREEVIRPIMEELQRQSGFGDQLRSVSVGGRVKVPGQYPLEVGMTVRDLVRAAGGLDQAAYQGEAELARYEVLNGAQRQTAVVNLDLARLMAGDPAADLALQPYDYLVVKEVQDWREQESITIAGEVRFPGTYPIRPGEQLASVIHRAGGLTELAFPEGSVFTREDLKEREARQLQELAERMRRDIAALSLQQAQGSEKADVAQAMAAGQSLLADLESTEPVGRLVIGLDDVMTAQPGSANDVLVKNGDTLVVPRKPQEVTVIGEVQGATSHLYHPGLSSEDYIDLSGGFTQRADKRRVFVIRANGEVASGQGSTWFRNGGASEIRPGDTVVVPLNAQQMRPLTAWTSVTQILYNIAVAVAAVNSF